MLFEYSMPAHLESEQEILSVVQNCRLSRSNDKDACSVCMEDLHTGSHKFVTHSGCGHWTHLNCLVGWFRKSRSCPICRHTFEGHVSDNPCYLCSIHNRPAVDLPCMRMNCCQMILHRECLGNYLDAVGTGVCMICHQKLLSVAS